MVKPELLLPVGNVESFYAALEGGADAVYVGLKRFNARGRAKNFTFKQLHELVKVAKEKNVKVYLTLNTVVKNKEIGELVEILHFLEKIKVDAVIIQDWGVFYIIRKFFPGLTIHASTQMANHNSTGLLFSQQKGFKRVVLSRELTMPELLSMHKKKTIETEVFVHGALCYSFSGMCLFSSFLGGSGANRGLCAQPCRRAYNTGHGPEFIFNLKDNQQLENLDQITKAGISSLKVEGRMKSADYAYQVAKAYRQAIDGVTHNEKAFNDYARPKTSYFLGGDISNPFTTQTMTGSLIGKVEEIEGGTIWVSSEVNLKPGNRIRVQHPGSDERVNIKIKEVTFNGKVAGIHAGQANVSVGDYVYLIDVNEKKFPAKFKDIRTPFIPSVGVGLKRKIIGPVKIKNGGKKKQEVYLRINSLAWLRKTNLNELDGLILSLNKKELVQFDIDLPFVQRFKEKIFIELPKFIPEKSIPFYKDIIKSYSQAGIVNIFISHLSQTNMLTPANMVYANENVYVFNDAAIQAIKSEKVKGFVYPFENDFENLADGISREGIVPVYFYPELFYSRMPLKIVQREQAFKNKEGMEFRYFRKDGMTIILPIQPVSLLQYKSKLQNKGFHKYLIDVSYERPSKNLLKKIITRLHHSGQIQPSTTFNFKKELQ